MSITKIWDGAIYEKEFKKSGTLPEKLTAKEKKIHRAVAVKIAVNDCIMNEGPAVPDAIKEIDSNPIPDISMLMFVSDGKETGKGRIYEEFVVNKYIYK